jgi:hypothetical protein
MLLPAALRWLDRRETVIQQYEQQGYSGAALAEALFYESLFHLPNRDTVVSGMNLCDYDLVYELASKPGREFTYYTEPPTAYYACGLTIKHDDGEREVIRFDAPTFDIINQLFNYLVLQHSIEMTEKLMTQIAAMKLAEMATF